MPAEKRKNTHVHDPDRFFSQTDILLRKENKRLSDPAEKRRWLAEHDLPGKTPEGKLGDAVFVDRKTGSVLDVDAVVESEQGLERVDPKKLPALLATRKLVGGDPADPGRFNGVMLATPPTGIPHPYSEADMRQVADERDAALAKVGTDELTGLFNKRRLLGDQANITPQGRLYQDVAEAWRNHHPLSVVFLDGDHFKRVNDTHGHQIGDQTLKKLAGVIKQTMRAGDVGFRYGGEEFVMLLPSTDKEGAATFAERLRRNVEQTPFRFGGVDVDAGQPGQKFTASIGTVTYPESRDVYALAAHDRDEFKGYLKGVCNELIGKADAAMYQAKAFGRNRAVHALNHSQAVTDLSLGIADELHLSAAERSEVRDVAKRHDLGKLRIPWKVLAKRGELSPREQELITTHPIVGAELLINHEQHGRTPSLISAPLGDVAAGVRHHHENFDGSGYPGGLVGKEIPLSARIVRVADSYTAMTSHNPDRRYHTSLTPEKAAAKIKKEAGTLYDPRVVDAFLRVVERTRH